MLVGQLFSALLEMLGDKEHSAVAHMDLTTHNLMVDENFTQLTVIDWSEALEYDHGADGLLIPFERAKLLYNAYDLTFLMFVVLSVEKKGCFECVSGAAKMELVTAARAQTDCPSRSACF